MFLAILIACLSIATRETLTWPIGAWADTAMGYDLTMDYLDVGYGGPWSLDYLRGNRWIPPLASPSRGLWPYDRYGFGDPFDYPLMAQDFYGGYGYGYYPRTTDTKERYIKDYPYGETEVGVRDSVTSRNAFGGRQRYPYVPPFSGPRVPPYAGYFDAIPPTMPLRRMFAAGLGTPRPSSLRNGGDFMYMRR